MSFKVYSRLRPFIYAAKLVYLSGGHKELQANIQPLLEQYNAAAYIAG